MLSICCYIISQTTIDARTTALRKMYWPLPPNGDYHGQKFDQRRQAGMFKISIRFSFYLKNFRLGKTS